MVALPKADSFNSKKLTSTEWRAADKQRVLELEVTGTAQPYEKEYLHKNGNRVPVLAQFEEAADQSVAFVLDLTERNWRSGDGPIDLPFDH